MIEILAVIVFVAVMKVWWEYGGTEIAVETHDQELLDASSRGANWAMAVALIAFVAVLVVAALGGAL